MKRVLGFVGLIVAWEFAVWSTDSAFLPSSVEVLKALIELFVTGEIYRHITASLQHIMIGFMVAAVLGGFLGILITESKAMDTILTPVIDAMRPVAALTIFPLLIVVLGLGMKSKVFVICWTAWPAILLNTAHAIRTVDQSVIEAAMLDGAGRLSLLRHVKLPLGLPTIMTGLRIGMSGGWISLVSAEMLGASAGLGYSILAYSQTFRFAKMYSIIVIIALLGLMMNVALAWLQSRLDYDMIREKKDEESKFLRFHDRAASYALDSFKWLRSPRARG